MHLQLPTKCCVAKIVGLNFAYGIVSSINTDDDLPLPPTAQLMQSSVVSDGSPLATNGEHVFARWPAMVHSSSTSFSPTQCWGEQENVRQSTCNRLLCILECPDRDRTSRDAGRGLVFRIRLNILVKTTTQPRNKYCFIDPGIAARIFVSNERRLVYLANMHIFAGITPSATPQLTYRRRTSRSNKLRLTPNRLSEPSGQTR
jgi:hypothetical protein